MSDPNSDVTEISSPIVDVRTETKQTETLTVNPAPFCLMPRPEELDGTTYACSPPQLSNSYYLTINNIEIGERLMPFEIFVESKNVEGLDLLKGLMLMTSATLRHECSRLDGNPTFILKQLRSVNSHKGAYFVPGGKMYNSVLAQFADLIEKHFVKIGLMKAQVIDEELVKKRKVAEDRGLLPNARQCTSPECGAIAVVKLDNCDTCMTCGASKCGV